MADSQAVGGANFQNHESIGNYKGVMLCNRPNEPGELPMKDR